MLRHAGRAARTPPRREKGEAGAASKEDRYEAIDMKRARWEAEREEEAKGASTKATKNTKSERSADEGRTGRRKNRP